MVIATEEKQSKFGMGTSYPGSIPATSTLQESPLSDEEVIAFHQHLTQLREWLIQGLADLEDRALAVARARRVSVDGDGSGPGFWEESLVQQAIADKRLLLHEVMQAFERIRQNKYGRCVARDCCIQRSFLEEMPWAKYCPACAARHP